MIERLALRFEDFGLLGTDRKARFGGLFLLHEQAMAFCMHSTLDFTEI